MLSLEALAVNSILWKVDLYQVQRRSSDIYLFLGGEGVDLTVTLGCAFFSVPLASKRVLRLISTRGGDHGKKQRTV